MLIAIDNIYSQGTLIGVHYYFKIVLSIILRLKMLMRFCKWLFVNDILRLYLVRLISIQILNNDLRCASIHSYCLIFLMEI